MTDLQVVPLTPDRWDDLVELFEQPGASIARGCWCMFYRETGRTEAAKGLSVRETRKRALKALVDRGGVPPGLIGYRDGRPIGWISLGPRADYARLARSPVMKPVDDAGLVIVCYVDARGARGVAEGAEGARSHGGKQGVTLVRTQSTAIDRRRRRRRGSARSRCATLLLPSGKWRRKPTRAVVRAAAASQ
jgi:hypothetical protein